MHRAAETPDRGRNPTEERALREGEGSRAERGGQALRVGTLLFLFTPHCSCSVIAPAEARSIWQGYCAARGMREGERSEGETEKTRQGEAGQAEMLGERNLFPVCLAKFLRSCVWRDAKHLAGRLWGYKDEQYLHTSGRKLMVALFSHPSFPSHLFGASNCLPTSKQASCRMIVRWPRQLIPAHAVA